MRFSNCATWGSGNSHIKLSKYVVVVVVQIFRVNKSPIPISPHYEKFSIEKF